MYLDYFVILFVIIKLDNFDKKGIFNCSINVLDKK